MTFGTLIVTRHGERVDYAERDKGINWCSTASRPFDPPLTEVGIKQAKLCGQRILQLCEKFEKPKPTHAYSSPMKRCGETCSNIAQAIGGISHVKLDHGLVESMSESWYRSWGVPGADASWGGPAHCRNGTPVNDEDMHPLVFSPAPKLFNTPMMMNSYETVVLPVHETHESIIFDASPYSWKNRESAKLEKKRLKDTVEALVKQHLSETVLVNSHGGPCTKIFEELSGLTKETSGLCGFTAISIYEYQMDTDGKLNWKNLVVNHSDHVGGCLGGIVE